VWLRAVIECRTNPQPTLRRTP